jgi:CHASE3 domain sensor protein
MTFRNQLIMGFGAALCILLLIGGLSYQRFLQEDSDQNWVAHTQEVLRQLDAALAASIQLNDDERAFALNGTGTYLESARRSASELQSHIGQIKTLTVDNPKQQTVATQLAELVNARVSLVAAFRAQSGATATLEENRRQLTTQIRNVFQEMRSEEERLLQARLQRATARARQMQAILGFGYTLSMLLFVITAYTIFR